VEIVTRLVDLYNGLHSGLKTLNVELTNRYIIGGQVSKMKFVYRALLKWVYHYLQLTNFVYSAYLDVFTRTLNVELVNALSAYHCHLCSYEYRPDPDNTREVELTKTSGMDGLANGNAAIVPEALTTHCKSRRWSQHGDIRESEERRRAVH
jgi:hypothetical protein